LGITACIFLFFTGSLLSQSRDERKDNSHIINFTGKINYYKGVITDPIEEKKKFYKTTLSVDKIYSKEKWTKANGKIILYLPKTCEKLSYGTELQIKGNPAEVKPPSLPGEFDYKTYLRFHHIYHQHFLKKEHFEIIAENKGNIILNFSYKLRNYFESILKEYVTGENEFSIASALLLGIRSGLSEEMKASYSSTGTMHILAISGLHVAVVFQLLMTILIFIPQGKFWNRLITFFFLLTLLWFFALITGFSPSVIRAVFMFSIILLSKLLRKNTNIYNTICFTAFCLLFYDPMLIADAGFQLSFLAVLGIVYLSDRIYFLINIENRILDYIWRTSSVSLAAQLAVLPLSLYYFKQFPLFFLLANLIAIPLSGVILYTGVLLFLISWVPLLNKCLGFILSKMISFMNLIIPAIGSIPGASIKGIQISYYELLLLYLILIFMLSFFYYKKLFFLKIMLVTFLLFSSFRIHSNITRPEAHFKILNIKNHLAIIFTEQNKAVLLTDSLLSKNERFFSGRILPYFSEYRIREIKIIIPGKKNKKFIREIEEDLYLMVFNSKKIFLNTGNHLKNEYGFDYWIDWKKNLKNRELYLISSEGTILFSSKESEASKSFQ
jgi:competence protein ComEC